MVLEVSLWVLSKSIVPGEVNCRDASEGKVDAAGLCLEVGRGDVAEDVSCNYRASWYNHEE